MKEMRCEGDSVSSDREKENKRQETHARQKRENPGKKRTGLKSNVVKEITKVVERPEMSQNVCFSQQVVGASVAVMDFHVNKHGTGGRFSRGGRFYIS